MHDESRDYISAWATDDTISVIELGARHTWGERIRDLFPNATYHGIDAQWGDGVDETANAATWQPAEPVDLVVSSEVFEHTPHWRAIVSNSFDMLRSGGRVVFTCAGPGRAIHGVVTDNPDDRDYYANVDHDDLHDVMVAAGFVDVVTSNVPHASTHLAGTDTQGTGLRP
jgi:trans-aconitate methyltransferase